MKFYGILLFCCFICSTESFAQSTTKVQNNVFEKEWIYPYLPDSLIKPYIPDGKINESCPILPPDSLRVFGNILGMGCDRNDNLYVWDDEYQAILKFNPEGDKLWRKKYNKGKGDGEFTVVEPAFAVSGSGKICLGDRTSKTLTVLDSSGHFLNKFLVNMWPASIIFGNDESIYVEGFQMSYSGNLIQHYSSSGTLLGSFCERQDSYTVNFSGNSGRLTKDIKGNIYYANFYPYKIDIFNKDGGRIDKIERNLGDFIPPKIENGNVFSMSGLKGIVILNNNLLGVFVLRDSDTNNWGLDIYDAERHHIKYIAGNTFPKQFRYRVSATDSKGNIYFDLNESNPVIVKYKINMNALIN